jgi:hypothetical protein
MTASPGGGGYLLVGADGAISPFGDAVDIGSADDPGLPAPIAGAAGVGDGALLATSAGEVVALGAARFCGSARALRLAAPIVGVAAQRR